MSPENISTLLTVLTVFTGVVALILVVQGLAFLAIYRRIRDLSARLEAVSLNLTKQVDSLTGKADSFLSMVKSTTEKVHALQENVAAITAVAYHRIVEVDAFLNEATEVGRLQIAKFQDVIDVTSRKIEETVITLQESVLTPIAEINALIRGVRTGLDVLFGRRRNAAGRLHNDEEMFI